MCHFLSVLHTRGFQTQAVCLSLQSEWNKWKTNTFLNVKSIGDVRVGRRGSKSVPGPALRRPCGVGSRVFTAGPVWRDNTGVKDQTDRWSRKQTQTTGTLAVPDRVFNQLQSRDRRAQHSPLASLWPVLFTVLQETQNEKLRRKWTVIFREERKTEKEIWELLSVHNNFNFSLFHFRIIVFKD